MDAVSPVDKFPASFTLSGTDDQGAPVALTNVVVALLPFRATPDLSTAWMPAMISGGRVEVVFAGRYADPSGALVVPAGGAYLWAKDAEGSTVQAKPVAFVAAR